MDTFNDYGLEGTQETQSPKKYQMSRSQRVLWTQDQTQDLWQNDSQFYLVRISVDVESKEMFHKFHSYKTIGNLNDAKKQTLSCFVNV